MKHRIDLSNICKLQMAENMRRKVEDEDLSKVSFIEKHIKEERAEIFGNEEGDSPDYNLETIKSAMRFLTGLKDGSYLTVGIIGQHLDNVCNILEIEGKDLPKDKAIRVGDSALILAEAFGQLGMLPAPNSQRLRVQSLSEELSYAIQAALDEPLTEERRIAVEFVLWDHISRFISTVERSIQSGQTPTTDPQ